MTFLPDSQQLEATANQRSLSKIRILLILATVCFYCHSLKSLLLITYMGTRDNRTGHIVSILELVLQYTDSKLRRARASMQ